MDHFAWLRLLAQGRGRVSMPCWYIAAIINTLSFSNTLFRWMQEARYGKAIDAVIIDPPPLFVLGHWRTGTSLLHELLSLDDRHTGPLTYHCFEPCHSILSETFFRKHLKFLLPSKRPMDNMPAGWEVPQEDEFALALLGQPSTYLNIAWPNQDAPSSALALSGLTPRQLYDWKRSLMRFLKMVLYLDQRDGHRRRLVLKSPPHTARIPVLLEMFPDAKFVYLQRDPYVLYSSTLNLWKSFALKHGMQTPRRPELLEEKVFREFRIMVERYEATKHLIPAASLVELRYEDFSKDLLGGVRRVYDGLDLGGWDSVKPMLEANVASRADYATNRYELDDSTRRRIDSQWGDIISKWGYG